MNILKLILSLIGGREREREREIIFQVSFLIIREIRYIYNCQGSGHIVGFGGYLGLFLLEVQDISNSFYSQLLKLVCNPYLRTRIMNCSGVIDVSLGYYLLNIQDISSQKTFKDTKMVFLANFMILVKSSFSLLCYHIYNFENHY